MNSERILIDYEKIRKNYDNALISTARGFENIYEFLDYWVPDENELKSIINLLQIAKDEKIKKVVLNISKNIKSLIDINKLEEFDIPNVKANHVEKTSHPCQFPIELVERLVLALTNKGDLVFDPFSGVGSSGCAAIMNNRNFWGSEKDKTYNKIALTRLNLAINDPSSLPYRPIYKKKFDHLTSPISEIPPEWK